MIKHGKRDCEECLTQSTPAGSENEFGARLLVENKSAPTSNGVPRSSTTRNLVADKTQQKSSHKSGPPSNSNYSSLAIVPIKTYPASISNPIGSIGNHSKTYLPSNPNPSSHVSNLNKPYPLPNTNSSCIAENLTSNNSPSNSNHSNITVATTTTYPFSNSTSDPAKVTGISTSSSNLSTNCKFKNPNLEKCFADIFPFTCCKRKRSYATLK
ncbi:hypothetical protein ACH5RR_033759 [Cinchona calisaya]|uniref:Uncharacterized protein n=1 Tax=Cinchona calisaya TaxID=153742 RepID=A0ABD2YA86_9GENT